ncbi:hypothetical protein IW261DRAFT_1505622 [Armillaria novae-zelandiae]|uniref:Uncharacterized protein n=1 Tax=Armillaria novae-zelandiae TaxID=153914 RepID=A0AA39NWP9_9AGAR|nr:hypothetical protein IW261DRAFT_1505622 [Armillaria novae-zelandiae]
MVSIGASLCFKSFPNFVCLCTLYRRISPLRRSISLLQKFCPSFFVCVLCIGTSLCFEGASLCFKSFPKFVCTCTLNLALPIISIGVSLPQNCRTLCVLPLFIIYSLCLFVQVQKCRLLSRSRS